MSIKELITQGRSIQKSLKYIPPSGGSIRTFKVYEPSDINEYYNWKEFCIRFLQKYCPSDVERFLKYSDEFEKHHYLPQYLSNMVGVLEACDALPSESMKEQETEHYKWKKRRKLKNWNRFI